MKKILSAALCAASLAFGLVGAAHASQFELVTLTLPTTPGNMTASAPISDSFDTAGEFYDDYVYTNLPAFSLDEFKVSGTGVTFTYARLYWSDFSDYVQLGGTFHGNTFDLTTTDPLPSALWVLEIYGVADAGGSYSGSIFSTAVDTPPAPPVPEPTGALLLLAGLGVVAARAKRSRRQAVAA